MELIILLIMIVLILLTLGVSVVDIALWCLGLFAATFFLSVLMFLITLVGYFMAKNVEATPRALTKKMKMEAIIYEYMDEETGQLREVTNLFPTDSLTKRLAFREKVNKIRVLRIKNYTCCYDKWTAITIFIGIPIFTCLGLVCLGIISLGAGL